MSDEHVRRAEKHSRSAVARLFDILSETFWLLSVIAVILVALVSARAAGAPLPGPAAAVADAILAAWR